MHRSIRRFIYVWDYNLVVSRDIALGPTLLDRVFRACLLCDAKKHSCSSIRDLLTIFDPKSQAGVMPRATAHNFAVSVVIAPKISNDLPGILATPRAKFHADR